VHDSLREEPLGIVINRTDTSVLVLGKKELDTLNRLDKDILKKVMFVVVVEGIGLGGGGKEISLSVPESSKIPSKILRVHAFNSVLQLGAPTVPILSPTMLNQTAPAGGQHQLHNLHTVMHTSGSTGAPKSIPFSMAQWYARLNTGQIYPSTMGPLVWFSMAPLAHGLDR
jgi:long-subunit acyl-CoA synthetase (AMP-forming)